MKNRRILLYSLFCILTVFIGLNILLAVFDPLGVLAYMETIQAHQSNMIDDATGFTYPPADYDFASYEARMRRNLYRDVPMSVYADCVITFVGDSLTWGSGVGDWQTFASQIAARFDAVEFHNAGQAGYNVQNVDWVLRAIEDEANGFVYLLYDNDYYPQGDYVAASHRWLLPLAWYVYGYVAPYQPPYIESGFEPLFAPVMGRDNLLTFVFEGAPMESLASEYGAIVLPRYTEYVSAYDFHPNATGHEQIADAMYPALIEFTEARCHAEPHG